MRGGSMSAIKALPTQTTPEELSERDAQILSFERQWWKYAGAKETAIRELFDMSATRFYQVLNTLIDHPAALAAEPLLVKRLRRLRGSGPRGRSARRLGHQPAARRAGCPSLGSQDAPPPGRGEVGRPGAN